MSAGGRRSAADWASPAAPLDPVIDVLIPTIGRGSELAVTLAGLAAQDGPAFRVVVSDQTDDPVANPAVDAMLRVLDAQGRAPRWETNLPRRGLAEQRQFLLDCSAAPFVLFLDDDVWLEPGTLVRLHDAIEELGCGFVGASMQGLSFLGEDRPQERTTFEVWTDGVVPERVRRGHPSFDRWQLHNAANLIHLAAELDLGERGWLAYKVAWIAGCVLYRRDALVESGGFEFWRDLPAIHAGEDVAAEWRVMERFGGAGILPSGAVHLETPTTVPVRDVDALDLVFAGETSAGETVPGEPAALVPEGGNTERKARE